jgi:hypothetical protein
MLSGDFNFLIVVLVGLIAFVLAYLFYQYSQWGKLEWHAKLTGSFANLLLLPVSLTHSINLTTLVGKIY